ncbi:MAG: hypothetical protein JJV98_21150 [Desulfosarcina sp.]|nr:hypothetical protein [Desulfobacterales bacterium]
MDRNTLTRQVRYNCDLSDARYAGYYSICGLALRLRDLYKWEQRLPPWEERNPAEILEWIDRKEQLWERLQGEDFVPIDIDGMRFDPFDTHGINARLAPRGLFYGAGYALGLKPAFVLAQIDDRYRADGLAVVHLGRELARDLLTLPALSQNDTIVLRKEAARFFVWDQIFYITPSRRPFLAYALRQAGLADTGPSGLRENFAVLLEGLYDVFVRHEIGERRDRVFDVDCWRAMIASFPHSPVELLLRAVKDALADSGPNGPLPHMIADRKAVSLGFYLVFHDGLGRQLYPELRTAFTDFEHSGEWAVMDAAARTIHHRASAHTTRLLALFEEGRTRGDLEWAANRIRREFLDPLDAAQKAGRQ